MMSGDESGENHGGKSGENQKDAVPAESESSVGNHEASKVGYGRPPVHRQFKPGQSGNGKGRPKGHRNVKSIVSDVFRRRVTVREKGKLRRVSEFEAMFLANRAKALQADPRAYAQVMSTIFRFGVLGDDVVQTAVEVLPEEDLAIINRFLRRKGDESSESGQD